MIKNTILVFVIVSFFLCAYSFSQEEGTNQPEETVNVQDTIKRLIENLSSKDFNIREKATQELEKIGKPAEEQLKEALKSKDAEVVWRTESILSKINKTDSTESMNKVPDSMESRKRDDDEVNQLFRELFEGAEWELSDETKELLSMIDKILKETDAELRSGKLQDNLLELRRTLEQLEKLFESEEFPSVEELDKLLDSFKELKRFEQGKPEAKEKKYSRYRVWKNGVLVEDKETEEFYDSDLFGLTISPVTDVLRTHLGIPDNEGLLVSGVSEESLFAGKIESHDIILSVDGISIDSTGKLKSSLSSKEKTVLSVIRKGERITIEATLKK
ncbi:MAG: hypothetical protein ABIH42_08905 [Planctomycetota bacterium]